jgi:beta-lactamase regulating signal transducer with metallopeptidase domain
MIYLLAILFPPLALLIYGKIFQAIFNLLIWLLALISIPIAIFPVFTLGLPMIIWGIAVVHAILAVNSAKQDARAREVADAMRGRRP